jgi:hypothetical protein
MMGKRTFIHESWRGTVALRSAFTLIEVVISAALAALILGSAYVCLTSAFATQKMIEPRVDALQTGRAALGLITADLRSACPLTKDMHFIGTRRVAGETDADFLDFATHNYTPRRPGEGDFCQESFYLDKNPKTGKFELWRRRNPRIGLDPFSGGSRESIAEGVLGLRFEYYDGYDWYDDWGDSSKTGKKQSSTADTSNLSGMPEAVRITLVLDPYPRRKAEAETDSKSSDTGEPPLVFRTVARLNLASSSRGGSSTSSSPGSEPAPPVQPNGGAPQ